MIGFETDKQVKETYLEENMKVSSKTQIQTVHIHHSLKTLFCSNIDSLYMHSSNERLLTTFEIVSSLNNVVSISGSNCFYGDPLFKNVRPSQPNSQ